MEPQPPHNPHGQYPPYNPNDPNNQYPPQGHPPQNYPPQGYPPQGYPPQGYPPQGYPQPVIIMQNQGGVHLDHKSKIMNIDGLFIKQKMDLAEVLTGCEFQNTYNIFKKKEGKEKKKGKKIWKAKEKSTYCQRNCVPQGCRAFDLKIKNVNRVDEEADTETCLKLKRPCTCTCLCCNRPFITVNYVENDNDIYIGKIRDPYDFCNRFFIIYDKDDKEIYKLEAYCCQCGLVCKGYPCEPCERVEFLLTDLRTKEQLSPLIKKNKDCLKAMLSDADNFALEFPKNSNWEERSLLMAATLFIDYMMFEEKGGNQGQIGIQ